MEPKGLSSASPCYVVTLFRVWDSGFWVSGLGFRSIAPFIHVTKLQTAPNRTHSHHASEKASSLSVFVAFRRSLRKRWQWYLELS